ncbi:hypothetical protein FRB90_004000, partial [Tulasnella sp. 427]
MTVIMNNERRRNRRNRRGPARQRMVADPPGWDTSDDPRPASEDLERALPAPTTTTLASTSTQRALPPLVTQPADDSVAAAIARRQNTVVTVTSTQFGGTLDPNASSQQQSEGLPIATIAASASVGVFLAVSIVGCWWWFCKRPYTRKHR